MKLPSNSSHNSENYKSHIKEKFFNSNNLNMEGKFKNYKNIQNNIQVTKSYDIMPLKGEKFFKNHRENKR